jgi:hypothetical protein
MVDIAGISVLQELTLIQPLRIASPVTRLAVIASMGLPIAVLPALQESIFIISHAVPPALLT